MGGAQVPNHPFRDARMFCSPFWASVKPVISALLALSSSKMGRRSSGWERPESICTQPLLGATFLCECVDQGANNPHAGWLF